MSEQDWRWIPVSESPGEEPRKICVLKDGEKDVYWWTDTLGFEEDITHWCEVRYPPLPESEKPPIQEVCEWLGISEPTAWSWQQIEDRDSLFPEATPTLWYNTLLWRIEGELIRAKGARPYWSDLFAKDAYLLTVAYKNYQRQFEASTRGEALLKAAEWVMEQENGD